MGTPQEGNDPRDSPSATDEDTARHAQKAKVAEALDRVVREEAGVLERLKDA
jgi:hypothetical protein